MHEAVSINRRSRVFGVVPVTQHDGVTPGEDLAGFTNRHGRAGFGIGNPDLDMRMDPPDRGHAPVNRIIGVALERHRAGFGHAIGNGDFGNAHIGDDTFHQFDGTGRTRHDAGAQT